MGRYITWTEGLNVSKYSDAAFAWMKKKPKTGASSLSIVPIMIGQFAHVTGSGFSRSPNIKPGKMRGFLDEAPMHRTLDGKIWEALIGGSMNKFVTESNGDIAEVTP